MWQNGDGDMIEVDKQRLKDIEYIVETEYGNYDRLVEAIGQERADEFCQLGFIKTGNYLRAKTWRILDYGKFYYDVVKPE